MVWHGKRLKVDTRQHHWWPQHQVTWAWTCTTGCCWNTMMWATPATLHCTWQVQTAQALTCCWLLRYQEETKVVGHTAGWTGGGVPSLMQVVLHRHKQKIVNKTQRIAILVLQAFTHSCGEQDTAIISMNALVINAVQSQQPKGGEGCRAAH